MAAAITSLEFILRFHVLENPGDQPSGVTLQSTYAALDQFFTTTPSDTIPAALAAIYKTLFSGDTVIDLTAAQGSNGNINANGKKLRWVVVNNQANANSMTVQTGDTNGYTMTTLTVPAGGFLAIYLGDASIAVDGTHKTIKLTGTNGDTPEVLLILG